jgi:hypothetical protein
VTDPRSATSRKAFAGVVLLVLGLGLLAVYRLTISSARHSYAPGAIAPTYVTVTAAETYSIAIPNGVQAERDLGLNPRALRCTINIPGQQPIQLKITPEPAGTKAINQIATFVAPVSGQVHIDCAGASPVFVDNADDAAPDRSGLFLVLATIMLAIGGPLTLSAWRGRSARRAAQDDEVQGLVDGADPVVEHSEVSGADRLDGGA